MNFSKVGIHIDSLKDTRYSDDSFDKFIEKLNYLNSLCKDKYLTLMLENGTSTNLGFLTKYQSGLNDFRFLLDVGHINCKSNDLTFESFLDKLGSSIEHIHLHDNNGESGQHLPIGIGNIDMVNLIKILKKYNFDKTISIEFNSINDIHFYEYSKNVLEKIWYKYYL